MDNSKIGKNDDVHETEFKRFATKRVIASILLTVTALWVVGTVMGFFEKPSNNKIAVSHENKTKHVSLPENMKSGRETAGEKNETEHIEAAHGAKPETLAVHTPQTHSEETTQHVPVTAAQKTSGSEYKRHTATVSEKKKAGEYSSHVQESGTLEASLAKPVGVAFVEAMTEPMDFELNKRFWGWRPNDILNFTDNVNNFQLGVLEVTRRTAVALAERISRTGSTAAFDDNLQNAMNWFMVKADRYWFPSPESKYKAGIKELKHYKDKLIKREGNFYTRPDNLIPLLMAYEDLLGSCEENLVKQEEDDGSDVSFFKADDYFYYSKGVASAMLTILEAIAKDFHLTVKSRRGAEVLHHAIEACHHATQVKPFLITNSSLSGILANHRANLAAPMSHARFYINVLIKTLST